MLAPYIKTVRLSQQVKNLFVLFPVLFLPAITEGKVLRVTIAFVGFCFFSAAVYAFNDAADREEDALHPRKRSRPVATGTLSVRKARLASLAFLVAGFGITFTLGLTYGSLALLYLLINVGYSTRWKKIRCLDIASVASGFAIRSLAGAASLPLALPWPFVAAVFFFAAAVVAAKRMREKRLGTPTRSVLARYSTPLLKRIALSSGILCVLFLGIALWAELA